jgi:hypothetical protein
MRRKRTPRTVHRSRRLVAAAGVAAVLAAGGLAVGWSPEPARAALAAVGVDDTLTMKHDRTAVVAAPGVLGNDVHLVGGTTAILVSGVSHGSLSLRSDGGYTYSPAAAYVGADSFRYRPSGLLSTAATVWILVTNATPVALPDAYSGSAGTTLVVAAPGVLANDVDADGDVLVTNLVGSVYGSLSLDLNGGFRYTPPGGFSGMTSFSYRVWDGVAWSVPATVSLTILPPAPTPVPTQSSSPTPTATPTPTPIVPIPSLPIPSLPIPSIPLPTPIQPLPSIGPSLGPSPTPTGSPAGSASPDSSRSSGPSGTPSAGAAGPGGSTRSDSGPDAPAGPGPNGTDQVPPGVSVVEPPLELGSGTISVLAGLETWAVPAAVISGPGLLVLLWIALQATGAALWIPAARRLRDDVSRPGRRRAGGQERSARA